MASIGGHPVEPEGTELKLVVPSGPVSLQSRRKNKAAFSQSLRAALGTPQYLLSGEVSIYAEWLIHERVRYETLQAPDVDKVVLDALCGPGGVLVNDCQVQHVSCHWIDWTSPGQQLTVTIRHSPDDWIRKKDLVFVGLAGHLCWPVNLDLPSEALGPILSVLERMVVVNQQLRNRGEDWYAAQRVLPVQQPFHSGRLRGFKVMTPEEVKAAIGLVRRATHAAAERGDAPDEGAPTYGHPRR